MSTRRLSMIPGIPDKITKAFFRNADKPKSAEEDLWRQRAARMVLDALGYTNLTVKPREHNSTVRHARRFFRGMYDDHPDPKKVDNPLATFDCAGVCFPDVRDAVLRTTPILMEEDDHEDDEEDTET